MSRDNLENGMTFDSWGTPCGYWDEAPDEDEEDWNPWEDEE